MEYFFQNINGQIKTRISERKSGIHSLANTFPTKTESALVKNDINTEI